MDTNKQVPQLPPLTSAVFTSASTMTLMSRKEVEAALIANAFEDDAFKQALLANPKSVIEAKFSLVLPDDLTVAVLEESDSEVFFVLPHNPYTGIEEADLQKALGMDLTDIAGWLLDQQYNLSARQKAALSRLIVKAWRDASFKRLLLTDPELVLGQELDQLSRGGVVMQVVEETREKIVIILPYMRDDFAGGRQADSSLTNLPVVIGSHVRTEAGYTCDGGTDCPPYTRFPYPDCPTVLRMPGDPDPCSET